MHHHPACRGHHHLHRHTRRRHPWPWRAHRRRSDQMPGWVRRRWVPVDMPRWWRMSRPWHATMGRRLVRGVWQWHSWRHDTDARDGLFARRRARNGLGAVNGGGQQHVSGKVGALDALAVRLRRVPMRLRAPCRHRETLCCTQHSQVDFILGHGGVCSLNVARRARRSWLRQFERLRIHTQMTARGCLVDHGDGGGGLLVRNSSEFTFFCTVEICCSRAFVLHVVGHHVPGPRADLERPTAWRRISRARFCAFLREAPRAPRSKVQSFAKA